MEVTPIAIVATRFRAFRW